MSRYARNAGAVFGLKLHLVWCPKYRRPVLAGKVAARLRTLLYEKAGELEMMVHAPEIMPDHVQLFVEFNSRWAVARIAASFKDSTSRARREEFVHVRSRLPTLWSRSYYAGTVSHVSAATVRRYIEAQTK